jgi:hypothetical protein
MRARVLVAEKTWTKWNRNDPAWDRVIKRLDPDSLKLLRIRTTMTQAALAAQFGISQADVCFRLDALYRRVEYFFTLEKLLEDCDWTKLSRWIKPKRSSRIKPEEIREKSVEIAKEFLKDPHQSHVAKKLSLPQSTIFVYLKRISTSLEAALPRSASEYAAWSHLIKNAKHFSQPAKPQTFAKTARAGLLVTRERYARFGLKMK